MTDPPLSAKIIALTLFAGLAEAASQALGIASIRHRSALHALSGMESVPPGVVSSIHQVIAENWRAARSRGIVSASRENWRWCEPQTQMAKHNTSPEVRLERAIARCGAGWANQVPICSGVAGPSADRRRAIDLVRKVGEGHFELIELKIASDTPLYAAIEIIGYGCVWLLARLDDTAKSSELLTAAQVDLIVLAPASYYTRWQLGMLAKTMDGELAGLGRSSGVCLSFRFEVLPDSLVGSALPDDSELLALLEQRWPL